MTSDMADGRPLVSVIICTRNRKELVIRAIDSVFAQESVRTEIVVVDDCSNDGTLLLLEQTYEDRIIRVRLDTNRRVSYATNRGFEKSSGDFIALLGDDDYWTDPKKLLTQLEAFECSASKLGVVGTWWSEKHQSGELISREPAEPENWKDRLLQGGSIIGGSTSLMKRSAWIAAGGLDERMPRGTDSDLFRRIIFAGYSGKIVRQNTTVVDVSHGHTRMTTNRGFQEFKRTAYVHAYLLWKYRKLYFKHPKAMLVRLRGLIFTPLRALFQ